MAKKNKVKKTPKLIWPCIFGLLALLLLSLALWISYVGSPRIDGLSMNNVMVFSVLATVFSLLCAWRSVVYHKRKNTVRDNT